MNSKKIIILAFVIVLFIAVLGIGKIAYDKLNRTNYDANYFGGTGDILYAPVSQGSSALYDDNIKYFNIMYKPMMTLAKNNEVYISCDIASCLHDMDDCKAYTAEGEYFCFEGKLYKFCNSTEIQDIATNTNGFIFSCEDNKTVFDNPIPKDMTKEQAMEAESRIATVRDLGNGILKVESNRHAYLLNDKFEPIYWYGDVGKFYWGLIRNNVYYYVNELYQLTAVSLDTFESNIVDLDCKIIAHDSEGDYFYFTDEYKDLYKYSLVDQSKTRIGENVFLFSLHDNYIYYTEYGDSIALSKKIIDTDGNFIFDYSDYEHMGADTIIKIEGKVYSTFEEGVAVMDANGKNYKEYYME